MPLTNPFLAPDRVPPPATRTLLPGTAQPYYPGDPVPNSPAIGVPTTPPASIYTPAPTYAPPATSPTTPTTPPGGWNTGPVSSAPPSNWQSNVQQVSAQIPVGRPAGEAVGVPTDDESLRFGATTQPQIAQASYQAPLAPSQADQFTGAQNPLAPAPYVGPVPATMQRDVSLREVSSAELPDYEPSAATPPARIGRDGFRPQGTAHIRDEAVDRPKLSAASTDVTPTPSPEPVAAFGYDPQYRWLRGQLLFTPTTGQWQLQYVPPGGPADSLGGAVPITNPQVLGAMQPGELVMVEGRLEMLQLDAMSVVPAYTIAVLQRQQQAVR